MPERTEEHILAKEGVSYIKKTLPIEWITREQHQEDYGWDLEIQPASIGQVPGYFYKMQVKSESSIKIVENCVVYDLRVDHARHYLETNAPVVLVVYDRETKKAYWIFIQQYLLDVRDIEKPEWRNNERTVRIHIPLGNEVSTTINQLENLARTGPNYLAIRLMGQVSWREIVGANFNPKDIIPVEEQLEKYRNEALEMLIHLGQMEAKAANREQSFRRFLEAYQNAKKKNDDVFQAKAIAALISFYNPMDKEQHMTRLKLILEALTLVENGVDDNLHAYFLTCYAELVHLYLIKKLSRLMVITQTNEALGMEWANYIVSEEILEINTELININKYYHEAISKAIDLNNPYLLIGILLKIGRVLDNYHVSFRVIINIPQIKMTEKNIDALHELVLAIAKSINNKEMLGKVYEDICSSYWLRGDKENCIRYGEIGMEIADEIEDAWLKQNLEDLIRKAEAGEFPPRNKDEAQTRLKPPEDPIEMWEKTIEMMIQIHDIDLSRDDRLSRIVKIGIEDFNPTQYLKHCENIEIFINSVGDPGRMLCLPTAGSKMVFCKHKGGLGGMMLKDTFDMFVNNYCKDCEFHKPRNENFKWNGEWKFWNERVKELKARQ